MKIKEKEEWAKLLFTLENLSQIEIAEKVGVSKVTVNKWVKKGKWEEQKASLTVTREQQLQRLYMQIAEINKTISERDQKYATPAEADSINKLASAIDKMERESSLADIISVSVRFLNWLRLLDLAKAKELSGLFDAFIKDNLK
ncbi:MAG TPA: DDE transposase family protein [Ferruginibacter sp.]|jgi:transcriptional regulator with XRE-family HTH domain|nr:DDE transposase family protein [Bacteroidales bacterium]HPH85569.1 DDE transposase family protein [Ferruginibacter sp.]